MQASATAAIRTRNPWPGQQVNVVDGATGRGGVSPTTGSTFTIAARAGPGYLVRRTSSPVAAMTYQPITGTAATGAATLSARPPLAASATTRHIGIP